MNNFTIYIGLEVHLKLTTKSKLLSRAPSLACTAPNTLASYVDTALPGTLPLINKEAVMKAITLGWALNAEINSVSTMSRKHYSYPDMSKGYQITQFDIPIIREGYIQLKHKKIRIKEAHLEEDASKMVHVSNHTNVDDNRAGTTLLELVTAPDINSASEALEFLKNLRSMAIFLGVTTGDMAKGDFKVDVNISVNRNLDKKLGTKCELKNLNSFKFIQMAIDYESQRQISLLNQDKSIAQETRGFNEEKHYTFSIRRKEEGQEYCYISEPDIMPLTLASREITELQSKVTEKFHALETFKLLPPSSQEFLIDRPRALKYYIQLQANYDYLIAYKWIRELWDHVPQFSNSTINISIEELNEIIHASQSGLISIPNIRSLLISYYQQPVDIKILLKQYAAELSDNHSIEKACKFVLAEHPKAVQEYKQGKMQAKDFLIGKTIAYLKQTDSKQNFDYQRVSEIVTTLLTQT